MSRAAPCRTCQPGSASGVIGQPGNRIARCRSLSALLTELTSASQGDGHLSTARHLALDEREQIRLARLYHAVFSSFVRMPDHCVRTLTTGHGVVGTSPLKESIVIRYLIDLPSQRVTVPRSERSLIQTTDVSYRGKQRCSYACRPALTDFGTREDLPWVSEDHNFTQHPYSRWHITKANLLPILV